MSTLQKEKLDKTEIEKIEIELDAFNFLNELGAPANLKGRRYLIDAIRLCVQFPEMRNKMMKQLYLEIAKLHNTNAGCVERNIRTAIEHAYNSNPKNVENLVCIYNTKPTNAMVIAFAAEKIQRMRQSKHKMT